MQQSTALRREAIIQTDWSIEWSHLNGAGHLKQIEKSWFTYRRKALGDCSGIIQRAEGQFENLWGSAQ
jgi:hypothetical protein